eukprot:16440855-Heterocapsa_arctica.AAC.1
MPGRSSLDQRAAEAEALGNVRRPSSGVASKMGKYDGSVIFDNPEFEMLERKWARRRLACGT